VKSPARPAFLTSRLAPARHTPRPSCKRLARAPALPNRHQILEAFAVLLADVHQRPVRLYHFLARRLGVHRDIGNLFHAIGAVAEFVANLEYLLEGHAVQQTVNAGVAGIDRRFQAEAPLQIQRQLRQQAQRGAVDALGVAQVHDHTFEFRIVEHALQVVVNGGAEIDAHVAHQLQGISPVTVRRQDTASRHLRRPCL